jgi:hypothetical protein
VKLRHVPIGNLKMSHNGRAADKTPKQRLPQMRKGEARRLQVGDYSPLLEGVEWAERGSPAVLEAWTALMMRIEESNGQKCVAEPTWPALPHLPGYVEVPMEDPTYLLTGKRGNRRRAELFGTSSDEEN